MPSRTKIAGIVLGVVVLAGGVGWVAGRQIDSPAEIAARTAAPNAAPILVPAEERVISTDIVTRGTVRFGAPQQLTLVPSVLKTGAGVAARFPLPGTELREGDLMLTTSGRPVFLLTGVQPMYRDLGPGISGDDVRQLEEALARLGIDPGPADGVYDAQTEVAVTAWYARSGFAAFTASAEQLATVRALQTESNSSQIDVIGAQDSVASGEGALSAADATYARAQEAARETEAALVAVVQTANANDQAAVAGINAMQAAVNSLTAAAAPAPDIAAAQAQVALATATANATRITGDADVARAQAAVAAARADVTSAQLAVKAAERALGNADAILSVRARQADLTASALATAQLKAGVQVPADEVIFVTSVPVRVSEVNPRTDQSAGPLITVTNATVAVDGALRLEEAGLAKPGMAVQIDEPDLNIDAKGVVSHVAAAPGTNGVDGFHVYFEVVVDGAPANLVGASVRLTVPVTSTGESVLAVPVSAVTLSADGSSRIQRDNNGALEYVTVEPGLSAEGYVAVKAIDSALEPGDLVVIGFGDQGTAQR
jgi:peptidoglycan hydrolase-like protein with peptidoglycan-binding domain